MSGMAEIEHLQAVGQSGDWRIVWKILVFQSLIEQVRVIGRLPQSGFAQPPAIRAEAG
jgi:hypothetical protein